MAQWSTAHRVAHLAAARVRGDAGLPADARVDVFTLARECGLTVTGLATDKLFGAYAPASDGGGPGMVVKSTLRLVDQRHTAGHELGHHALKHGSVLDEEKDFRTTGGAAAMRSLPERTAEAFAAWLLMPRPALAATLRLQGAGAFPTPTQVYVSALLLGTSYRGTARHLQVARLISCEHCTALMRVVSGKIKNVLDDPQAPPRDPHVQVWRPEDLVHAGHLVVGEGDRIVLSPSADHLADQLEYTGIAEIIHHGDASVTLTALRPATARPGCAAVEPVAITIGDGDHTPLSIEVAARLRGPDRVAEVPSVAGLSEAEMDAMLAARGLDGPTD
jgi:hypothetical protein